MFPPTLSAFILLPRNKTLPPPKTERHGKHCQRQDKDSPKTLMFPRVLLRILYRLCFLRFPGTESLRIRVADLLPYLATPVQHL